MRRIKDRAGIRSQRAFTIIELMVVIAIMATVVTIAAVGISNSLRQSKLKEATLALEGGFGRVRNIARSTQREVVVLMTATEITAFFDVNNNSVYELGVDYIDVNGNGAYDAGVDTDGRFYHEQFTNGIQFAVASIPGAGAVLPLTTIRFNSMGHISDANRVITISLTSEANRRYRIWIYTTGSTRVERSEDAGVTWPTRPW